MLYLIGGASRSGKTTIAQEIARLRQIPYLSLDWLVMGFTNGLPDYGIHDLLFPDEIAEKLWSFLQAMCESMLWTGEDHVIEGEAILPELILPLLHKHPDQVRICFMGYTDVDVGEKHATVKQYSKGERDWLSIKPDPYIDRHIQTMINHSRQIKNACKKTRIRYFDTSDDYEQAIKRAVEYLLTDGSSGEHRKRSPS